MTPVAYVHESADGKLKLASMSPNSPADDTSRKERGWITTPTYYAEGFIQLQEVVNALNERLENVTAANAIPMPDAVRVEALTKFCDSAKEMLAPHITYDQD